MTTLRPAPALRTITFALAAAGLAGCTSMASAPRAEAPVPVKVFIAAMFEIGQHSGDRAGEFQHWFERSWKDARPVTVPGALQPVYCNSDGVCGAVLGMGKVNASASMQAMLLHPAFDFSKAYYILSGVAGTPPSRGTIADVSWATWLVDYDLGHRWAPEENTPGAPTFMPRKGYEEYRRFQLDPALVAAAIALVIKRSHGAQRIMSLRGAVNFDQGHPKESTLQHLDPAPGETAGGFAETVQNIQLVGSRVVDDIVARWPQWQAGVPAR